jgi:hypothetical protein
MPACNQSHARAGACVRRYDGASRCDGEAFEDDRRASAHQKIERPARRRHCHLGYAEPYRDADPGVSDYFRHPADEHGLRARTTAKPTVRAEPLSEAHPELSEYLCRNIYAAESIYRLAHFTRQGCVCALCTTWRGCLYDTHMLIMRLLICEGYISGEGGGRASSFGNCLSPASLTYQKAQAAYTPADHPAWCPRSAADGADGGA